MYRLHQDFSLAGMHNAFWIGHSGDCQTNGNYFLQLFFNNVSSRPDIYFYSGDDAVMSIAYSEKVFKYLFSDIKFNRFKTVEDANKFISKLKDVLEMSECDRENFNMFSDVRDYLDFKEINNEIQVRG